MLPLPVELGSQVSDIDLQFLLAVVPKNAGRIGNLTLGVLVEADCDHVAELPEFGILGPSRDRDLGNNTRSAMDYRIRCQKCQN